MDPKVEQAIVAVWVRIRQVLLKFLHSSALQSKLDEAESAAVAAARADGRSETESCRAGSLLRSRYWSAVNNPEFADVLSVLVDDYVYSRGGVSVTGIAHDDNKRRRISRYLDILTEIKWVVKRPTSDRRVTLYQATDELMHLVRRYVIPDLLRILNLPSNTPARPTHRYRYLSNHFGNRVADLELFTFSGSGWWRYRVARQRRQHRRLHDQRRHPQRYGASGSARRNPCIRS